MVVALLVTSVAGASTCYPFYWNVGDSFLHEDVSMYDIMPGSDTQTGNGCSTPGCKSWTQGVWPTINSKGEKVNGGVPQAANLTLHLETIRQTLPNWIPGKCTVGWGSSIAYTMQRIHALRVCRPQLGWECGVRLRGVDTNLGAEHRIRVVALQRVPEGVHRTGEGSASHMERREGVRGSREGVPGCGPQLHGRDAQAGEVHAPQCEDGLLWVRLPAGQEVAILCLRVASRQTACQPVPAVLGRKRSASQVWLRLPCARRRMEEGER